MRSTPRDWLGAPGGRTIPGKVATGAVVPTRAGSAGSSVATNGASLKSRALPGPILGAQAKFRGLNLAVPNPLADQADWKTGGREPSPLLGGPGSFLAGFGLGGLILLGGIAYFVLRKK